VRADNTPPAPVGSGGTSEGTNTKESGAFAPDCAALGRSGSTQAALDCYAKQSQKSGMAGELALYEIARLRKDVMSDYAGALEALKTYDARFPNGSLRGEVQVSRVELLGRLGRNDEALAESARLLETPWGKERAADLHLLRGNLYRQSLHDFARAEAEYARISDERGPAGDEAQFQRAACLERLGQASAARNVYESYLKRPQPRHAAEVKARLQALTP
jgi:tetratricopeptide (TPR) repeat protein